MDSQHFCDFHQIGQRPGAHFPHDVPAVYLHRNLGNADLGCYLFVQPMLGARSRRILLMRRQGEVKGRPLGQIWRGP
jgi:hypothetical protein